MNISIAEYRKTNPLHLNFKLLLTAFLAKIWNLSTFLQDNIDNTRPPELPDLVELCGGTIVRYVRDTIICILPSRILVPQLRSLENLPPDFQQFSPI